MNKNNMVISIEDVQKIKNFTKDVKDTNKTVLKYNKAHIHSIFDKKLKEIDNEYLVSYVNMRKYPTILFVMAKIMEMNNQEQNQIAMYLYNSI